MTVSAEHIQNAYKAAKAHQATGKLTNTQRALIALYELNIDLVKRNTSLEEENKEYRAKQATMDILETRLAILSGTYKPDVITQ